TFNQQSVADAAAGNLAGLTLAEYFHQRHFAPRLLTDYLAPMGAAIWSAPSSEIMDFPAENFVAFFSNHRLLQYDRPVWRTVKGGSARYVEKLTADFRDQIRLGCAVTSIERTPHGVIVNDSHGKTATYDHVVIASHSDPALLPRRRRASASWNFLRWPREGTAETDVSVTYWMNRLQQIDHDKPLFV